MKMYGVDDNHFLNVLRKILLHSCQRRKIGGNAVIDIEDYFTDYYSLNKFRSYAREFGLRLIRNHKVDLTNQALIDINNKFSMSRFAEMVETEANRAVVKGYGMPNETKFDLHKIIKEFELSGNSLQRPRSLFTGEYIAGKGFNFQQAIENEKRVCDNIDDFLKSVRKGTVIFDYPEWHELRYKIVLVRRFYDTTVLKTKVHRFLRERGLKYYNGTNNDRRRVENETYYKYIGLHKHLPDDFLYISLPITDGVLKGYGYLPKGEDKE